MSIAWLADELRAAGLTVVEHAGWKTHDRPGTWDPRFIVVHATAAPRSQPDETQVRVVRDGRSDLQGPIANACIDRRGRWHVLSAGRCNTTLAGTAGPFDGQGNTHALGIEACNDNGLASPAEAWPQVQYDAYVTGVAAICRRMGWPASRAVGHREHCPGRKTDPTFSMTTFRSRVAAAIEGDDMQLSDADIEKIAEAVATIKPWASEKPISLADGIQQASKADDALKEAQALRGVIDAQGVTLTALGEQVAEVLRRMPTQG